MKNLLLIIIISLAVIFTFNSCKKPGCVGSAGKMTVQQRTLNTFEKIVLLDNIDLELVQSDTERMEITAPENILPNIQSVIEGGILTISNETDCRWMREPGEKIRVRLFFRNIINIDYNGSGNITNLDTIRVPSLRLNAETGAGNIELTVDNGSTSAIILKENAQIKLHGRSDQCATYCGARGQLDLDELLVKSMYIIYSGLADTHVHVTDHIEAYIRYKGNVYYKGNPVIDHVEYFSSGQLIKLP